LSDKTYHLKAPNSTELQEWDNALNPSFTGGDIVGETVSWNFHPIKGLTCTNSTNGEFQWNKNSLSLIGSSLNFCAEWQNLPSGFHFLIKSGALELIHYEFNEKTRIFIPREGSAFDLQQWKFDGSCLADRNGEENWTIQGSIPLPVAFFVAIFTPEVKKAHNANLRSTLQREAERRKKEEEERKQQQEDAERREEECKKKLEEEMRQKQEEQRKYFLLMEKMQKEEQEKKRIEEEQRKALMEKIQKEEQEKKRIEEEEKKRIEELRLSRMKKNDNSQIKVGGIEYRARNGRVVFLYLSSTATSKYNVQPYQRVNTPSGPGTVIGVDQEHGHLWFQLDKDLKEGLSFWDDVKDYDTLLCKGIFPMNQSVLVNSIPLPKASELMLASISDTQEREMMMKAIQESLLDQTQKDIQQYFLSLK